MIGQKFLYIDWVDWDGHEWCEYLKDMTDCGKRLEQCIASEETKDALTAYQEDECCWFYRSNRIIARLKKEIVRLCRERKEHAKCCTGTDAIKHVNMMLERDRKKGEFIFDDSEV